MGGAPLDRDEFERWRAGATRALDVARLEFDAGFHEWACSTAEQAAQLAVKGLLHGLGQGPRGHDLVLLGRSATDAGIPLCDDVASALLRLSRYYVATRYPDAHAAGPVAPHYGTSDAAEAIADSENVVEFVDRSWHRLDA